MVKLVLDDFVLDLENPQWVMVHGQDSDKLQYILDVLQGKVKVSEDKYLFEGCDVNTFSQRQLAALRKKDIINISDKSFLMDDLTVEKNLQMQLRFSGIYPTKAKRKIAGVLQGSDLMGIKDHLIAEITPLQRIQVKLMKAVVVEAKLICGYNPFVELNRDEIEVIVEWIKNLVKREFTIVFLSDDSKYLNYGDGKIVL